MSIRTAGDSAAPSSASKAAFCLCHLLTIEKGVENSGPLWVSLFVQPILAALLCVFYSALLLCAYKYLHGWCDVP